MDDWDEEKLDEVIKKKHGSEKSNATDIVSCIVFIRDILGAGTDLSRIIFIFHLPFRYVNISLKQSRIVNMVGFGRVLPVVINVIIVTHCLLDMFSRRLVDI